jgi:hypothetical protein
MKRALSILALASLAACGGGGGEAFTGPAAEAPKPAAPICTVSLEGDSIQWGGYANGGPVVMRLEEPHYLAIKRMRPKYEVTDFSKNGEAAVTRLPAFLNISPPGRIVVIQYGVNDTGAASNVDAYKEALRSMVQRVKAFGKIPVITGLSMSVIPKLTEFNAAAKQVATEENVIFADWASAVWNPDTDMDVVGGAHPKQAYSLRLAEKTVAALDRAAPECR